MEEIKNEHLLNSYLKLEEYLKYFPKSINRAIKIFEFNVGEVLIKQDSNLAYLFMLVKGKCRIHTTLSNGKSIILNTIKPISLIGELELLDQSKASFNVTAIEKTRVLAIPIDKYQDILLNDINFLKTLCIDVRKKEQLNALKVIHTYGFPLENRLASFILENKEGNIFNIKKVEIAQSLGVSYRHLELVMKRFVDLNYLVKTKRVYTIINEKALKRLAFELEL